MSDCYPVEPDLQTLLESEARLQDGFLSVQRCGRREQCTRDAKRIAELEARMEELEARRNSLLGGVLLLRDNLNNWDEKTLRLKILDITRAALAKEGE